MVNLSPAAQAILDAYQDAPIDDHLTAAAVLRVLAARINGADAIRQDVLDIANELENAQ